MTQMVPADKNYSIIQAVFRSDKTQKALIAVLGKSVDPVRFVKMIMGAIQRTPDLQKCTPTSILIAAMQAASLQLEVDGITNRAHIVPFGTTATFILGYKGVVELILRPSKQVTPPPPYSWIDLNCAVPVFKGDRFTYTLGLTPTLVHEPTAPVEERTYANLTHVYTVFERADGKQKFHVMTKPEIETSRARARSKSGPWATDPIPMALKSCILQMKRVFELDPATDRALERDSRVEAGEAIDLGDVIDIDPEDIVREAEAALAGKEQRKETKLDKMTQAAKAAPVIPSSTSSGPANTGEQKLETQGSTPTAATPPSQEVQKPATETTGKKKLF